MEIFKSNLYEIKKSGSLKMLGGLLALFHFLQFVLWYRDGHTPLRFAAQEFHMCWSMFENCDFIRFLPLSVLSTFYYAYGVFALIATIVLLLSELVTVGYICLVLAWFLSLLLYFQDLRLSSNDGYFILAMTTAFLLVPSKHRLMRGLVVSFFVARGLSEASPAYLNGTWYLDHLKIPIKLAEWLAALSVIVQMIGGACLLFRDGRFFWTGWLSLFAFECGQLFMGEILQPSLSLGALMYVLFDEFELRKAEREYLYQSFIRPEPSFLWGGVLLALFWAAQLLPLAQGSAAESAAQWLDVWALHPEAAQEDCHQRTLAVYHDRIEEIEIEPQISRQPSMACNLYMRYLDMKAACRELKEADPNFVTLSSEMRIRNYRTKTTKKAFEVKDVCHPDVTFKRLGEIEWTMSQDK